MYLDGRPTEIRLNEEAKVEAIIEVEDPTLIDQLERGAEYASTDIPGRVTQLQLPANEDPDCGHISAVAWQDTWVISFDVRYTKERLDVCPALLVTSWTQRNILMPSVDGLHLLTTMFSAIELAAKATLWTGPYGRNFKDKMKHGDIHYQFSAYAKTTNASPQLRNTFEDLRKMRGGVRYAYSKTRLIGRRLADGLLKRKNSLRRLRS